MKETSKPDGTSTSVVSKTEEGQCPDSQRVPESNQKCPSYSGSEDLIDPKGLAIPETGGIERFSGWGDYSDEVFSKMLTEYKNFGFKRVIRSKRFSRVEVIEPNVVAFVNRDDSIIRVKLQGVPESECSGSFNNSTCREAAIRKLKSYVKGDINCLVSPSVLPGDFVGFCFSNRKSLNFEIVSDAVQA